MKTVLRNLVRSVAVAVAVAAAVALGACSSADTLTTAAPGRPHNLAANSSVTLTTGTTLNTGSSVTYSEGMPSSGSIYLTFDGRINYSSTAGNSTILEVDVNGTPITFSPTKGSTYTYGNQSRTEYYYDNRGSSYGQSTSLWGLFWSPDFTQNTVSSDSYYVSTGSPYRYEFDISSLINYGQTNTVAFKNQGGWVATATGISPVISFGNITLRAQ